MRTRVGVDVGGTFTDVTLVAGSETLVTAKVPSTADQSEGVIEGIEKACAAAGIDPAEIEEFSHAMTVSTNALLERSGARTALVTTAGFRDVLEIGRQNRPALYDLHDEKPQPLVPRSRRYELPERATPDGIERPVDPAAVRDLATTLQGADVESVAVALLHAYVTPDNERAVAAVLREELDVPVSASHAVLPEFREFERTSTTVVDAYVTPAIDRYVGRLTERAASEGIPEPRIMQSNGGIASADTVREHAVGTALSGPAAGVVGADRAARAVGAAEELPGVVTFDMGGTSSDVSLVRDGDAERTTDTEIDGIPIKTPMVDINTIGSGGGSIAWVDSGGALRVGPRSAGADPGPACYGNGGTEPTVTDANVVLGYVGESTALGGELSLDVAAAEAVLADLADEAGLASATAAARGVYRVANAKMTRAIREITVERGFDPREFGLVAFGGAGPMHAAGVADDLDIGTVIVPVASGVLSAYGLLDADERYDRVRTHLTRLDEADPDRVAAVVTDLADDALAESTAADPTVEFEADLRYAGQSFELTVPIDLPFDPDAARSRFHAEHERTHGYRMDAAVELVNLRATVRAERSVAETRYEADGDSLLGTRTVDFGGEAHEAAVHDRLAVPASETVEGPAVLEQAESTTVVPPEWTATVRPNGALVIRPRGADAEAADGSDDTL
jgi:N-methylhydantoinase A